MQALKQEEEKTCQVISSGRRVSDFFFKSLTIQLRNSYQGSVLIEETGSLFFFLLDFFKKPILKKEKFSRLRLSCVPPPLNVSQ